MIRVDNAIDGVHARQGCYLCLNPNQLVDTEVSIDYEGVLAICTGCAKDLAQTAGWNLEVSVGYVGKLETSLAEVTAERDSLVREMASLRDEVNLAAKRHRERMRRASA